MVQCLRFQGLVFGDWVFRVWGCRGLGFQGFRVWGFRVEGFGVRSLRGRSTRSATEPHSLVQYLLNHMVQPILNSWFSICSRKIDSSWGRPHAVVQSFRG